MVNRHWGREYLSVGEDKLGGSDSRAAATMFCFVLFCFYNPERHEAEKSEASNFSIVESLRFWFL